MIINDKITEVARIGCKGDARWKFKLSYNNGYNIADTLIYSFHKMGIY